MKFNLEHVSNVKKKITFEIPYEAVKDEIEQSYKSLKNEVTIKGFRKGKAPRTVLEKYYQGDVEQEVLSKLVRNSCLKAFKENQLEPIGEPHIHVEQFKPDEIFKYSATVEVFPEVDTKDYLNIPVTKESAVVEDKEIEDVLSRIRNNYAELKAAELKALKEGDFAVIDYTIKLNENLLEEKKDAYLEISTSNPIYGFEEKLIGLKASEETNFNITLPSDHPEEKLASKEISVSVKIKEVKEKILPELNDDFAKQLGEYENLGALKNEIKATLLRDKELAIRGNQEKELLKQLREKNFLEIPESLLAMEINSVTSEYARTLSMSGVKPTKENLEKHFEKIKEEAGLRVYNSLLLKNIYEKENIEVGDEEVNAQIALMARMQGQKEKEYMEYFNKEENFESLRNDLKIKKTLAFLLEKADYKD